MEADGGLDDNEAPRVVVTSPEAQASSVDTRVVVSAVFSEPIAPDTAASALTLSANGAPVAGALSVEGSIITFVPDARLLPEISYHVTLGSTIEDLAGNKLADDFEWSFTTRAGGWSNAAPLEAELDMQADALHVAHAAPSLAVAVWLMSPCNGSICQLEKQLWASVYANGEWSAAQVVPTDSDRVLAPHAAIDASGRATVVWYDASPANSTIRANRYEAGSWSGPATLSTEMLGDAQFPRVSMDPSGNAYAVWQQDDGATTNIWASSYTSGSGWSAAAKLETAPDTASRPDVTVGSSPVALWIQGGQAWASTYAGTWSPRTLVGGDAFSGARLAADASGNVLAIWSRSSNVYASRYTGVWSPAEEIDASNYNVVAGNALTLGASGDGIAVWVQGTDIWNARFSPSDGWSSATKIEASGGASNLPSVTHGASGTAMAAWQQPSGEHTSIWANSFSPADGWSAPHLVEDDDSGAAHAPRVFFDASAGTFVAVWLQSLTGYRSVYASQFE